MKNMLPSKLWKSIQQLVDEKVLLRWVKDLVTLDLLAIEALPELAEPFTTTRFFRPKYELEIITADYIDFLRNQIALKPRGQEWADILEARVKHLTPFIGREVAFVHLYYFDGNVLQTFTINFNSETNEIIHYD